MRSAGNVGTIGFRRRSNGTTWLDLDGVRPLIAIEGLNARENYSVALECGLPNRPITHALVAVA